MATTSLTPVSDWFVEETTSSSVTLAIQFDGDAHPDDTGWVWFFYRKSTSNTGTYKKSLTWKKITSGGIYYTITITGLSANTAYVGRLTDDGHHNDSAVLFSWTTAKKEVPDPYVSSVVSDAAGELTITVANRNDKAVVFKWAPPENSSLAITKTSSAWQDSFTFDNCYYGQKCFGGAEIKGYTISSKSATVKGTCTCSYSQNDLTITFSTDDDGNYPEWSLDDTNWYSTSTSISKTFSAYGLTSQDIYFRATKNGKVLTEDYSITKQVNIKAPSTYTVSVSMATVGIQQYKVDYTDEDGNNLTSETYSESHTFTVKAGGDFKIADVTYDTGYEQNEDGKGKSFSAIKENKSVSLGAKKKTFTVTFSHRDYDNTDTALDTTTKTYEYGAYARFTDLDVISFVGYNRQGWNSSNTATTNTNSYLITGTKTIYVFYDNPALKLSVSSSLENSSITASVENGVANYTYQIKPGAATSNYKYKESTISNTSKTWSNLPRGQTYYIKVTDSDPWKKNHEYDSISGYSHLTNNGPSITYSSATLDTETGKYKVTFTLDLGGYTSAKIIDFDSAYSNSTSRTITCDYTQTSVSAKFYYNWEGTALDSEKTCTFSLTKPYHYTYSSSAYYWDDTLYSNFDNGEAYSKDINILRPAYNSYSTYLGYDKKVNGNTTSGVSIAVTLNSNYSTHITWKYRKDAYPYKIRLFYYDTNGSEVEETDNYPLKKLYNLDSSIQISGNLTGKGQLLYYLIGTNRVNGDGSDIYTIDLTNYKNTLVEIRAYFYMNLEWTTSPQRVSNTNILTAAWKGGLAGYRFEYFTAHTHHYYPGPSGYSASRSYTSSYNLPGGYAWQAQVIDRTGNKLGPVTISGLNKPAYDANTLGLDPSNNELYLTAKIQPFSNTGYHKARLEYKRSTDSVWTNTGEYTEATTGTTNLRFSIENDVRNNENDSIIYQSRVVWYKSDYDEENGYKYEHSSTIATWPIGYKIQLEISDKIQSLNVSYVTAANEVKLNDDLSGNTTHILWLQHGSKLVINSFSPVPGWYGPEFSIEQGEYEEIFEPATYTFDLINKAEHYRVYLYCGSNISQFTIRYCDFMKYNNTGSLDQGMTTKTITREDSPQTIEVPLKRSNFTIESWTGENANANMYDESTMSPTPTIVGGKYTYDAARFAFGDFVFNIDFYKTKFTKSAYVDYCTFQLIDENGIRDSEQITLTSDADGIYFYEFSPTQPYHTQIKIIDYKLIAGRKNFYMNISGDSERYYLKDYSNNLIPIERGESYIFNGDDYTNPSVTIEPDKYSVTCSYSYIDEEVFLGSPHKVTFTQQESGTKITEFIDFKTTKSITFTNTIVNNKYSIFADTEFTILTELWDAQSNRWIEIASEGNKTLPRDIPDFTIQPNISNRAYGDISNYQDYDKVVSYHWNITASLADATSITVIDNKTENVNTQKIPSGNQPFELDSTYYARIVLGATDGSDATWTSKWVKIDTPDAYTITFVLNNISSIAAKSDLTNNENKIFENNGVLTVSPNSAYEISGINSYSSLTTPYNRKMFYTSPVYYTITKDGNKIQNGVFVNRDNSVSKITGNMDTPALTITLTATPADWVWPNGYTKDTTTTGTPILTKGGPVNLFEYETWNELMFYLNKWGQYLNKLYTNYENTLMTSTNKTLTAAIYNHAYEQLNTLFTNLSNTIITNAVSRETQLTAKGLEDFGNTINYNNIKE